MLAAAVDEPVAPAVFAAAASPLAPLAPEELDDELVVEAPDVATDVELDVEPDVAPAMMTSSPSSSSASLPCVGIVMSAGLRPAAARAVSVVPLATSPPEA